MPVVTVCIPAYKSERWLASGLASVQRQTFADLQVLVGVEPVEPEPTVEICREFASDGRFHHYVNPTRLGWAGNIRALLERVDTPFFIILFHDDQLEPSYIETLLPPLLERPELSVCYADIQRFDGATGHKTLPLPDAGLAEQLLDFFLARADAVPIRGVTRSTVLDGAAFPENEFDGVLVESEWTLHLLLRGRALRVPRPLYLKRRPPEVRTVSES
jgi:glycosyltransferase involved in cell wall biosynthesis